MKTKYLFILYLAGVLSCTDVDNSLDSDVRFAINTAYNSKGLSYYQLPLSSELDRIPQDPNNPLSAAKVELGKLLFHEPGFGTVGEFGDMRQTYSCASCHHVEGGFQANLPQGIGEGGIGFGVNGEGRQVDLFVAMPKVDVQPLRTPSAMNAAFQTNLLWNGQFGATHLNEGTEELWEDETPLATNHLGFQGVETQAIAGLDVHRHLIDMESVEQLGYKPLFDQAFGEVEEQERYSNVTAGLAIAAYERILLANQSPFQQWLRGSTEAMSDSQKEGAILFFTKGNCNACHNGPSLASMEFHAIGLNDFNSSISINHDPSDPSRKGRASFTKNRDDEYKFKVPQLYNLLDSKFYGHGASFTSVRDIIEYKNRAVPENSRIRPSQLAEDFVPLKLSEEEINLLTDFVENALYDPHLNRYAPAQLPSGLCFPNNDWMSRDQLGCN